MSLPQPPSRSRGAAARSATGFTRPARELRPATRDTSGGASATDSGIPLGQAELYAIQEQNEYFARKLEAEQRRAAELDKKLTVCEP